MSTFLTENLNFDVDWSGTSKHLLDLLKWPSLHVHVSFKIQCNEEV